MKNRPGSWRRRRWFRNNRGLVAIVGIFAAFALFFTVGITAVNTPWSHQTCTVTGKYSNPLKASQGQRFDFIETTCGDFGFNRWLRGSDGFEVLEIGSTYELGVNGLRYLWAKPSVITWDEVY